MLRVALTGGVGSGKSAAVRMLRDLGAHIFQSDEAGRELMQPGQAVFDTIVAHFGAGVLSADGTLNRAALAKVAFDQGRLEDLNAIVHPAVIAEQARWAARVMAGDPKAVAVVESALIFETKHAASPGDPAPWRTRFDRIVVVVAPESLRRERYIARIIGFNPEADVTAAAADFDRRAASQWSDEQKAAQADFVLRNDGSLDDLQREVEKLYSQLQQESATRAATAKMDVCTD